jgi:hypothetical protein
MVKDFASFKNSQTPIVGQPFSIKAIWVPCNATLHCNCGGADVDVTIENSVASACPSCGKSYNCAFNPMQNKVEFSIAVPEPEKVPS